MMMQDGNCGNKVAANSLSMKRIIKNILSIYYKNGGIYSILFGPLRGSKLIFRKDVNYREMLGLWEKDSLILLQRVFQLPPFSDKAVCVADVGANLGVYTIFLAKMLKASSAVFAFEPSSSVLSLLKRNITINRLQNVTLVEAACSDKTGEQPFYLGKNHHQSSFFSSGAGNAQGENISIPTVSLDDYFAKQNKFPDFIKMDIEGAAVFALKGCRICFTQKRPVMLIESHSREEDNAIFHHIIEFDYAAYSVDKKQWILNDGPKATIADKIGGTMLLVPEETKSTYNF
jgi:FkbM family methyltransferase